MALAGTTIWEVQTGGSDTANGGCFDPGQVAGMFTDGAATSANTASPVFTSASYSFVAGDAGAKLFIGAGSNWTPGWYPIVSVASGAATLNAAIGSAVVDPTATVSPSTVIGCATTASPTGATWSIDYSQQASAQYTYTDLASAGAGLTVSSAAKPFAKEQVGNCLVITGGTNFNTGRYVIASVAAGVATVLGAGNITSGAGASGTGGLGGALASPGQSTGPAVSSNRIYVKTGTYTVTSASTSVAAGCVLLPSTAVISGYDTVRGDLSIPGATGTRPTLIASGISTFTLVNTVTFINGIRNLIVDGASLTSSRGIASSSATVYNCHAQNCTNNGFNGSSSYEKCSATGCSSQPAFTGLQGQCVDCEAYGNTVTGFNFSSNIGNAIRCISSGNSGAGSDGFNHGGSQVAMESCVAYGNGRAGFKGSGNPVMLKNCISEANGAYGYDPSGATLLMINCAGYNNTSGNVNMGSSRPINVGFVTGSASFFTNPGSGDFSLNSTAGGGAVARAAGYPGVFPRGTTTGYADIGAAQHQDSATGGFVGIIGG